MGNQVYLNEQDNSGCSCCKAIESLFSEIQVCVHLFIKWHSSKKCTFSASLIFNNAENTLLKLSFNSHVLGAASACGPNYRNGSSHEKSH